MSSISDNIKKYRIKEKITQKELGEALFVTDKTVSSWESGRTYPDVTMLKNISNVLNCTVYQLISGAENINYAEVEVKIELTRHEYENLLGLLKKVGNYSKKMDQRAIYYEPSNKRFTDCEPIREWLRIRTEGNKKVLGYKYCHDKYCDEYEVSVDNDTALMKIFEAIGLKEIAVVSKKRIQYMYEDKYEFSFDIVDNLGYFVEIKVKNIELGIEEEYEKLINLVNKLNIDTSKITTKRYPHYFIKS